MHDPNLPEIIPARNPNPLPPRVDFAKWPPDDGVPGGLPAGGGVPAGGGYGSDDGNFKKGRTAPIAILIGVLAVGGFAAFMAMGAKQEATKLSVEQGEAEKKNIFVLPKSEQATKWREWSMGEKSLASEEVRMEALKQLAWNKDPEGVKASIDALSYPAERVQAIAATALAEYGRPMGEPARDALLAAVKKAGPGAKPQIAWALVVLGETRALDEVMALYRLGHLSKVQRLGGGVAFDTDKIVQLISL
ncbi:MAG TPA: HEAT repeat domain-containing protein, partial [Polyangiaceae bacterium]|nr:HEAT repeat domain-containing protein [Polyangiaceae bacterium]